MIRRPLVPTLLLFLLLLLLGGYLHYFTTFDVNWPAYWVMLVFYGLIFFAGAYAAILRKGAAGAGAIFVVHNRLDSTYTVYSPAPQTVFEAGETTERRFEKVADAVGEEEIRAYLDRQVSFDPDCWIVETERRDPPAFLTVV